MIQTPRFKSHLTVRVVPPDLVFFLHESGHEVRQGRLLYLLAPLIDGRNTAADIVRRTRGRLTAFDVRSGLLLLEAEGFIADAESDLPPGLAAFRDSLNVAPELFRRRLKKARVGVVALGKLSPAPFSRMLRKLGLEVAERGGLTVVLTDDYLRRELEPLNLEALRRKRPWMLVKPAGAVLWLGPVFRPPGSACWGCLARRLRQNRRAEAFVEAHAGGRAKPLTRPAPGLTAAVNAALNLAAIEVLKWAVRADDDQPGNELLTLDVREMKLERHAVARLDDCEYCSDSSQRQKTKTSPSPIILRRRRKVYTTDGGHRSTASEQTFEKYARHVSPLTGVVDRVKPFYSDANNLVHVYTAGHAFAPVLHCEEVLRGELRRTSTGKGMTPRQARTSALCEALERYSGVFRGDEWRERAAYGDLGGRAVRPDNCLNFSASQYEGRDDWNRRNSAADRVPMPFDEGREVEWSRAWSLTDKRFKYVPTAYCFYGYALPADHDFCRADSNGNAAGNTLEEAILHGFLELLERDCTAMWWYNRAPRPAVNLDAFGLPYFKVLHEHYRALRRDLWVLDITNDFGIPAFAALSASRRKARRDFILGLGAHLDPAVALARALTEMNQFLPGALSGRGGRVFVPGGADVTFLLPDSKAGAKGPDDFPRLATDDFREDVLTCVRLARERGLETLVLDQTRADVGLPVVKVLVPGLRHFRARFGEGRLYDVPVELGWVGERLTEGQLNPARFFV